LHNAEMARFQHQIIGLQEWKVLEILGHVEHEVGASFRSIIVHLSDV
jgi:hypothetical protein